MAEHLRIETLLQRLAINLAGRFVLALALQDAPQVHIRRGKVGLVGNGLPVTGFGGVEEFLGLVEGAHVGECPGVAGGGAQHGAVLRSRFGVALQVLQTIGQPVARLHVLRLRGEDLLEHRQGLCGPLLVVQGAGRRVQLIGSDGGHGI